MQVINKNNLFADLTNRNLVKIYSYSTLVAVVENGKLHRIWNGHSVTTMKHINQVLEELSLPKVTKKRMAENANRGGMNNEKNKSFL